MITGTGGGKGGGKRRVTGGSGGGGGTAARDGQPAGSHDQESDPDKTKQAPKGLKVTAGAKQRLDEMDRERRNLRMKSKWAGGPAFLFVASLVHQAPGSDVSCVALLFPVLGQRHRIAAEQCGPNHIICAVIRRHAEAPWPHDPCPCCGSFLLRRDGMPWA